MSTLKLKGSTSGYVEITAPAIAGDNQITLPTTAGTVTVKDASGNTQVGTGVTIGSPSANVFTLSTGGGERLRVDNSGTIIAGVTTVSAGSTSAPSITPSGDSNTGIFFPAADTVCIGEGGVEVLRISSNSNAGIGTGNPTSKLHVIGDALIVGVATVTSIVETSSITLKENIHPITNSLDKVIQLNPVTYDRKSGQSKNEAGLIAEEVNDIIPNIVSFDSYGNPTGINYTKLSVYLIDAIKELKKEIDILKGN